MSETKYTWIKGRIFQRKDETSPFRTGIIQGKNEAYTKFTLRHSKKQDDGHYDNTYFDCVAYDETAELIDAFRLGKGDNLLCKAVKKERDYNGKHYISYTVYDIFRQIEKPKQADGNAPAQYPYQQQVNQAMGAVQAARQQQANQSEFDFDYDGIAAAASKVKETGMPVDIPF